MSTQDFYDRFAPYYHLIYPDWTQSVVRQGRILDAVIRGALGSKASTVLDVSCGIGTQAIGLAACGYRVTASDLSPCAIERARKETSARGLDIAFSVADMATAFDHHKSAFDVVLSADNSLPHLLDDAAILGALRQFYRCTSVGGACIITLRDYDQEDRSPSQVRPYGIRLDGDTRYVLLQTWEFHGDHYDVTLYCIEHQGSDEPRTVAVRSTYYAIRINRLVALMGEAGFVRAGRIASEFYQPVLIGYKD